MAPNIRKDLMNTISYIDGIKDLHANCRLISCVGSYANEHQSDYHGITLFKFFALLVLAILLAKAAITKGRLDVFFHVCLNELFSKQ